MELATYLKEGETTISNWLLRYYKRINMTDTELVFYLQLLRFQQRGNMFPDIDSLAETMQLSRDAIYQLMESLLKKDLIHIDTVLDQEGRQMDCYDLTPAIDRINWLESSSYTPHEALLKEGIQRIEQLIGRALGTADIEHLKQWIDQGIDLDVIYLAFKEATINHITYAIPYVNKILQSWKEKGVQTADDAARQIKVHRSRYQEDRPASQVEIPMYHQKS